jgi:hypothetical protein
MPRESKLLTEKQLAIAEKNGIPKVTVYKRLDRGWDVEEAISKPTRKPKNVRREDGLFVNAGRGERRYFSLPVQWENDFKQAIANSELSESEWIEQTIIDKLKSKKKQAIK